MILIELDNLTELDDRLSDAETDEININNLVSVAPPPLTSSSILDH